MTYHSNMSHTCSFCKLECKKEPFDDYADYQDLPWFNCEACNVSYKKKLNIVEVTRFYAKLNDRRYCLNLIHKSQRTQIFRMACNTDEPPYTLILSLPYMVPNINPTNCQDKIITYITFS